MISERALDKIMDKVCRWGDQFITTKYFEALTEEQKERAESVVLTFTEHAYRLYRIPPEKWNSQLLEKLCLTNLPEMMVTDESYYRTMALVLSAFFEFLAEHNLVKTASDLAKKVRTLNEQIIQNGLNPDIWNVGKTIAMAAVDAGVDVGNKKELDKFFKSIIDSPLAKKIAEKSLKDSKGKKHKKGDVLIFTDIPFYIDPQVAKKNVK